MAGYFIVLMINMIIFPFEYVKSAANDQTTINPLNLCGVYTSCNECLGKTISNITKCYWCTGNDSSGVCLSYPSSDSCPFGKSRWQACFISYDIMILCLAILAVLIVLFLLITLYCSCKKCFRRRAQRREDVENRRHTLENEERRTRNEQRATERRVKYDEIRQKYGLSTSSAGHYSRFENEPAGGNTSTA